jgi:hypothetical protein
MAHHRAPEMRFKPGWCPRCDHINCQCGGGYYVCEVCGQPTIVVSALYREAIAMRAALEAVVKHVDDKVEKVAAPSPLYAALQDAARIAERVLRDYPERKTEAGDDK